MVLEIGVVVLSILFVVLEYYTRLREQRSAQRYPEPVEGLRALQA